MNMEDFIMKLNKSMLFIMTLMVLIVGISAVSAAGVNGNNTAAAATDSPDQASAQASGASKIAGDAEDTGTVNPEVKTDKKDMADGSSTGSLKAARKESSKVEETKKSTQKSLKNDESEVISITKDNANDYFTNDENDYILKNVEGKTVILDSTVSDALDTYQRIIIGSNCTVTGGANNVTFTNHQFVIDGTAVGNVVISNMTLAFDQNKATPDTWNKDIDLLSISGNINATIENVIIQGQKDSFDDLTDGNHYFIYTNIQEGQANFVNVTLNSVIPSGGLEFDMATYEAMPRIVPVWIANGTTNFVGSSLSMVESANYSRFAPTIELFYVKGSNNSFVNNSICLECLPSSTSCYLYGFYFSGSSNNTLTGNNITAKGKKYTNGIYFAAQNYYNNIVSNNYIHLVSGESQDGGIAEDSSYGINIENSYSGGGLVSATNTKIANITVSNNTVIVEAYNPYAIELYGGVGNSSVLNNTIVSIGHTPSGITAMGYNLAVENNTITVIGETNKTESSADYFKPTTTGIHFQLGLNNTIRNNKITAANGTGIQFTGAERNTTIEGNDIVANSNELAIYFAAGAVNPEATNNSLIAILENGTYNTGDDAVSYSLYNNATVENNTFIKRTVQLAANVAQTIQVKTSVSITGNLANGDNLPISNAAILITLDNTAYAAITDENGNYELTSNALNTVGEYDLTVAYGGNYFYNQANQTVHINVLPRNATFKLVTDTISAKMGDKITFISQITDEGTVVNQGYVVFKLNGVTLKDENGTAVKVKVANGIAKYDWILPNYSAKVYNITTVYGGSGYNRAEGYGNLTVVKTNSHIEADIINITGTGNAALKVNIYDEHNNIINLRNTTVSIKVNGKTVLSKVSVANGVACFSLELPPSSKPYNITIIAGENSLYANSTTTFAYANNLPKAATTVSSDTQVSGGTANVYANVRDSDGNLVKASPKVAIKIDGKTVLTNITAVNGTLNATIPTPTTGMHKLLVIAGETTSYASSRNETSIAIQT